MNIPSLPTDNLYKFMALFGLVIIVVSTFVPDENLSHYRDAESKYTELLKENTLVHIEVINHSKVYSEYQQMRNNILDFNPARQTIHYKSSAFSII